MKLHVWRSNIQYICNRLQLPILWIPRLRECPDENSGMPLSKTEAIDDDPPLPSP